MRLFNFGSINIDHVYQVPHLVQPGETLSSNHYQRLLGGKGANQSIALARAQADVVHLGRYHINDTWVLEVLQQAGVDCQYVKSVDIPTGHAMIQVDGAGENCIVLYPGANHSFHAAECADLLHQAGAQAGDWLLLQNECSATAAMIEAAHQHRLHIAFNPAPMTTSVHDLPLQQLDLLVVNAVEAAQLLSIDSLDLNHLPQQLAALLPETQVVVTLGAQGALWAFQGRVEQVASQPVTVRDTTGAGDTFTAYYLQAVLMGKSTSVALQVANQAAAMCVQRMGASSSIPHWNEVGQALTH